MMPFYCVSLMLKGQLVKNLPITKLREVESVMTVKCDLTGRPDPFLPDPWKLALDRNVKLNSFLTLMRPPEIIYFDEVILS